MENSWKLIQPCPSPPIQNETWLPGFTPPCYSRARSGQTELNLQAWRREGGRKKKKKEQPSTPLALWVNGFRFCSPSGSPGAFHPSPCLRPPLSLFWWQSLFSKHQTHLHQCLHLSSNSKTQDPHTRAHRHVHTACPHPLTHMHTHPHSIPTRNQGLPSAPKLEEVVQNIYTLQSGKIKS